MSAKPSMLIIAHTYVVGEHRKKLPSLARHFDLTCATVRSEDLGSLYGLEGDAFNHENADATVKVVPLEAIGSVGSVTRFFMKGLGHLIRSRRWDFVLVENEPWSWLKWQTLLIAKMSGKVRNYGEFTWENVKRPGLKGWILSWFYRSTARLADFWIGGNNAARDLVTSYGMPGERAFVCPQIGVDTANHFPVPEDLRRPLREKFALPADGFIVGFAGRFVQEKGILDTFSAIEQINAVQPHTARHIHLALMGHGPLLPELQKRAQQHAWLHLLPAVPHHELPPFLQCLDVLALGSHPVMQGGVCWEEQFGHILIEASACGVVTVGSTSGAIPEVLGDTELTYAPGDVPALGTLLRRLHDEPAYLSAKRSYLLSRLQERFTHDAVADRLASRLFSLPA